MDGMHLSGHMLSICSSNTRNPLSRPQNNYARPPPKLLQHWDSNNKCQPLKTIPTFRLIPFLPSLLSSPPSMSLCKCLFRQTDLTWLQSTLGNTNTARTYSIMSRASRTLRPTVPSDSLGSSATARSKTPSAAHIPDIRHSKYVNRLDNKMLTEQRIKERMQHQESIGATAAPLTNHQSTASRSIPIDASPADMSLRLPKVVTEFDQPVDSELLRIAVIGPPNAGKSTLVNDLVRGNVSIVSIRAHTTRERVKAVMSEDNKQVVFYDTPGVVPEKNTSRLNRELVTASWKAIEDADHLLVILDCNKLLKHTLVAEDYMFQRLVNFSLKIPATLVLNKVDLVKNTDKLEGLAATYHAKFPFFTKTIFTSAQVPMIGVHELRNHLLSQTKAGNWLYPAEQKSDRADLQRVEDYIRSELYERLKIPYNVKQQNVGWTELEEGVLRIDQNLIVDRPGQKKIIVGTGGTLIRDITIAARKQIGIALQRRVMLNLQVKVRPPRNGARPLA